MYALAYAAEGASVVVADVDGPAATLVAAEIDDADGLALGLRVDVSDEASTREMAAKAIERFGKIDVLVNNAAVFRTVPMFQGSIEEIPPDEWDRLMAVNLRGPFLCARACVPTMKERGYGKIINISSTRALRPKVRSGRGDAGIHYATSKAGVIGFTRALAQELGRHNICVNAIAPGGIPATMYAPGTEVNLPPTAETVTERALQRTEQPEDLIGTAVFLASSDSDFMTGQTLVVDGGSWML